MSSAKPKKGLVSKPTGSSTFVPAKSPVPASGASAQPRPATAVLGLPPGTPGSVRLLCPDKGIDVTAWCGGAAPTITGGYGGIQRVARPRRVSSTDYSGVDPFTMSVALRFDGWDEQESVEPECAAIGAMARDPSSRTGPPGVLVQGPVPASLASVTWVIEDVQWGDSLWSVSNFRVRQDVTLALVQLVETDTVAFSPAQRAAEKAKAKPGLVAKKTPGTSKFVPAKKPATSLKPKG